METNTEKFVQVFLLEEDLDILKVDYFDFEDSAFYLEVEIGDFVAWLKDNGCLGEVTNIDPLRDYLETAYTIGYEHLDNHAKTRYMEEYLKEIYIGSGT